MPVFAALPRPPRVPWVNPARRGHLAGAAAGAAVLLLAAGFGIGYAVAPAGDDGHGHRFGDGYGPALHGRLLPGIPGMPGMPGIRPGDRDRPYPAAPTATSVPATPSGTSTR
jgi:hypothetical protein